MIVPWQGFELSKLINILKPRLDTKYVEFQTFLDLRKQITKNKIGILGHIKK